MFRAGGGGSKAKWSETDDGSVGVVPIDVHDPNYEAPEEETEYILVSDMQHNGTSAAEAGNGEQQRDNAPMLSLAAFKERLSTIFEEFFLSEDVAEALRSIQELNSRCFHCE